MPVSTAQPRAVTNDDDDRRAQQVTEQTTTNTIDFKGETFRTADRIGLMPLMKFAHVAEDGVSSSDMAGLAAMYDLLGDCLHPEDWGRFQAVAVREKADGDDLLAVVTKVVEQMTARPTGPPSDSSDGQPPAGPSSPGDSFSQAMEHLGGRPDLASIVVAAREARDPNWAPPVEARSAT